MRIAQQPRRALHSGWQCKEQSKGKEMVAEQDWYAIRAFHNKASVICALADKDGKEWYTPIREVEEVRDGLLHIRRERLMPSLIFIRAERGYLDKLKQLSGDNIYLYCEPGTNSPLAIPHAEMEMFRFVARTAVREAECIDEKLAQGERVRITGGIFAGAEGYIRRIHGTKRFVVSIEGVAAIATTYIPRQYIEKIAEE